jgi:hypothetical protein
MNILLELIIEGILPATEDIPNKYIELIIKYPNILEITTIIHEKKEKKILYNKKYQLLVNKCKLNNNNHITFGKLLGYTEQLDLLQEIENGFYEEKCILVKYSLNNKDFLSYWKLKEHTEIKKELELLQKMKIINNNIKLEIDYEYP